MDFSSSIYQSDICSLLITTFKSIRKKVKTATNHLVKSPWFMSIFKAIFHLVHFCWISLSTRSMQASWYWHNIWIICLPSTTNEKPIPKDHIFSSPSKVFLSLCRTLKPSLSSSIIQCILRAFSVGKVPSLNSWSWRTFFLLQECITKHLCCCSQAL